MPNYRFYVPIKYSPQESVALNPKVAHHITKVLRLKLNEMITLFDGADMTATAQITSIVRSKVSVTILNTKEISRESPLQIHLAQAFSKGERMDLVVQKATEIGVFSFTPLITQHNTVKLTPEKLSKKHDHWTSITQSASEQCGRNRLMTINPVCRFEDWIHSDEGKGSLFLDPRKTTNFQTLPPPNSTISIMIGPEGGFSSEEQTLAAELGCKGITLGPRILRTETAAIAACTLAQSQWGDLN
jgi:16S rRNA (uracil1498-N3)-methyltransferase